MVRLAQISDLHLLEPGHGSRRGMMAWRLSFLSAHRALDADDRVERAKRALAAVRALSPDHVVITGDLTEDGTVRQFEALAELLHDSGLAPSMFTLVPGNHDVIDRVDGWARAFDGPLRAFAATSRFGEEVVVGALSVVPVNTAFHQHWVFSAGRLAPEHAREIAAAVERGRSQGRAVALVQHHAVTAHPNRVVHWIDGLRDDAGARSLLREEHVHVVHGHIHRRRDRVLSLLGRPQVFSAPAVVDGDDPVRLYEVEAGLLRAADAAPATEPSHAVEAIEGSVARG